jgi:hypothetical protein
MAAETLHIEEMVLQIPGKTPEEAQWLAEEVARQLALALPDTAVMENLDVLNLRVVLPPNTPRERMAAEIAQAILGKLR